MGDLDGLVDQLNASRRAAAPGPGAALVSWLQALHDAGGSDLLLVAGSPPAIRVDGEITRLGEGPLDGTDVEDAVLPALPAHAQEVYRATGIADAALRVPGLGRFRVNLHHERGRAAAAIRTLPAQPPALASLGLPPEAEKLAHLARGLVLVCGPTGSGKTTTLAALVDDVNRRRAAHVVTIEDPIEYEHVHHRSVVEQVEIGVDAADYPTALRAALRQAPDVLVVAELRDPETMRMALAAAETGHLVLSTLHATDVSAAVSRLADSFPPERQPTVRQEIAMALSAVLTQTLLPRAGGGRVPAVELLRIGYGARQHIRRNALQHLHQEITLTRVHGSLGLEESLARLVKAGLVDRQEALARAAHVEELEALLARQ